jgi:uncharacterized protein HemX
VPDKTKMFRQSFKKKTKVWRPNSCVPFIKTTFMKKYLLIVFVSILTISATPLLAQQADSARISKNQSQIERDKKKADKLQRKMYKQQNRIKKQEKKLKRQERKHDKKLKSINKEEKRVKQEMKGQ